MDNYFDVPKILGGQRPGTKIIGGPSTPWTPCASAHARSMVVDDLKARALCIYLLCERKLY